MTRKLRFRLAARGGCAAAQLQKRHLETQSLGKKVQKTRVVRRWSDREARTRWCCKTIEMWLWGDGLSDCSTPRRDVTPTLRLKSRSGVAVSAGTRPPGGAERRLAAAAGRERPEESCAPGGRCVPLLTTGSKKDDVLLCRAFRGLCRRACALLWLSSGVSCSAHSGGQRIRVIWTSGPVRLADST